MSGALIETSARRILNKGISQGISQANKATALNMLQDGEIPIDKIARYTGLSLQEVEQLVEIQIV